MKVLVRVALAGWIGLGLCSLGRAADWPMWRCDARRGAASAENLPDRLHLQWVRELPPSQTAWPNEPRLQFDAAYQPIVARGTLFVGSMLDGSLTALETSSGQRRWQFHSGGPVRVAPVAWRNNVYFGSDDGYLYCLDAATGHEKWRVRGAPADRAEYLHLGNARLISFWPVRGGPVIDRGGTLYFGAGIWPSMGVFVTAVDAETGEVKWSNQDTHYLDQVRTDHNERHQAGLSPQGHFLLADGKLVVPNGRSMPARFRTDDGQLLYYVQGYRNGDSRVTATDRFLFVGQSGVVNVADGREVGNRWVEAGQDAPQGWDGRRRDLFEGPFYGYKFMPACDHRSAIDSDIAYGTQNGTCYAYNLKASSISLYDKQIDTQTIHPARWDAPVVWKLDTKFAGRKLPTVATIKAGGRIYSHSGRNLFAVDIPGQNEKPTVAWEQTVDGDPAGLLAADGKLFVVLAQGTLCCFGAEDGKATLHPLEPQPPAAGDDRWNETAERILRHTGAVEGYAVVLGVESGRLVDELIRRSELHVIAMASDDERVRVLRDRFARAGLLGNRVEVFHGSPDTYRLPPYLASLIAWEADAPRPEDLESYYEILRPYGGVLCLPTAPAEQPETAKQIAALKLPKVEVTRENRFVLVRRAGALPGASDWTHESANAARTFFSPDERVRAPLGVLWYGDGPNHGFEKHKDYGRGVKPQVAGGRLFAFNDLTKRLSALDAYTGRLLWQHEAETSIVRFVSLRDAVYVANGLACEVLDPATGTRRATFNCRIAKDANRTPGVVGVRTAGDLLLVALGFDLPGGHSHPAIESGLWDAAVLVALDRHSGEQLWVKEAQKRFNLHAIAAGGNRVYVTDSLAPIEADRLERREAATKQYPSTTIALDARTGKVQWQEMNEYAHRAMTGRGPLAIRPYDDWLAYSAEHDLLLAGKVGQMSAMDAATGESRWTQSGGLQPLILAGNTFISQAGQRYDVSTGKRLEGPTLFRRGGCNYAVGGKHLLFLRNKCATYVDIEKHTEHSLRNVRSGCSNSLVAAGGLLSVPCFSTGCVCNYPLQTSFAMVHMPEAAVWAGNEPLVLTPDGNPSGK